MRNKKKKFKEENKEVKEVQKPQKIERQALQKAPKEKFERLKMWLSILVSNFVKEVGTIPKNISNRILISNNSYITFNYISSIIYVQELGVDTPQLWVECLNAALRDAGNECILDVTIKNRSKKFDLNDYGLKSRVRGWQATVDNPNSLTRRKVRAAELLYTVEKIQEGTKTYASRIFLTVRGKTSTQVTQAENIILNFIWAYKGTAFVVNGDVKDMMKATLIMSNMPGEAYKKVPEIITSNKILAQMLPNCGSYNDYTGAYCGIDIETGAPYMIDLDNITKARNIYIYAQSGGGKTVMGIAIIQSQFEQGYAVSCIDVKGNEMTSFVLATGGKIVSLAEDATEYINFFKLNKDEIESTPINYYTSRISDAKTTMLILSGIKDDQELIVLNDILDKFLESFYIQLGVEGSNTATWYVTQNVTPFDAFDYLEGYVRSYVYNNKGTEAVARKLIGALKPYWTKKGSKARMFSVEYNIKDMLKAPTISFSLGILQSSTERDLNMLRLKYFYISKLNSAYSTYKYAQGIKTVCIMEEVQQIVGLDNDEVIMNTYVENWTLRRAQNQTNILLGNSVEALVKNPKAQPIIENTMCLFIGANISSSAVESLIHEFSLEEIEDFVRRQIDDKEYANSFLVVNRMQTKKNIPVVTLPIPPDRCVGESRYKVLKPTKMIED